MDVSFSNALKTLAQEAKGGNAVFDIINSARAPQDYFLQTLLPDTNVPSYKVDAGNLTIRATMAGLSGMDSEYPEGGFMDATTFLESTAKVANAVTLPEKALRLLQQELAAGGSIDLVEEALNFLDKMIIQPHNDSFEYLRGQVFTQGKLDWTFNAKAISIDYNVPSGNLLTKRTGSSKYGNASSKFWDDIATLQSKLNYNIQFYLMNSATFAEIAGNSKNSISVTAQNKTPYGAEYEVAKLVGTNGATSNDVREKLSVRVYNMEGEIIDESDTSKTTKVKFFPDGYVTAVGDAQSRGYRVGDGSLTDDALQSALGYTHLGPTVESGGQSGRWGR